MKPPRAARATETSAGPDHSGEAATAQPDSGLEPSADPGPGRPDAAADPASADTAAAAGAAEADRAEAAAARPAASEAAKARGRPIGAVVLLAIAAGLLWASSRMTWVSLEVASELGSPRTVDLDGGTWFGALTPLALALLATIAAVFAARGWLRRMLGVVVAVLAAVAAVPAYALVQGAGKAGERAARLAELRTWEHAGEVDTSTLPAVLTLLGAVAAFTAGVLLTRMPAETAQMSGKYDNPVFRKSEAAEQVAEHHAVKRAAEAGSQDAPREPLSGRVLWDALDAGADPTDDETNTPAAHDDPDSGEAGRTTR
ncbi:TIGR02234 family membrane protein [Nocardia sp. IFM 10818]